MHATPLLFERSLFAKERGADDTPTRHGPPLDDDERDVSSSSADAGIVVSHASWTMRGRWGLMGGWSGWGEAAGGRSRKNRNRKGCENATPFARWNFQVAFKARIPVADYSTWGSFKCGLTLVPLCCNIKFYPLIKYNAHSFQLAMAHIKKSTVRVLNVMWNASLWNKISYIVYRKIMLIYIELIFSHYEYYDSKISKLYII